MPENCVVKCVHRPRRVPGSRQAKVSRATASRALTGTPVGARAGGSRSVNAAMAATPSPMNAAVRNEALHPACSSSATRGYAAAICPV